MYIDFQNNTIFQTVSEVAQLNGGFAFLDLRNVPFQISALKQDV